MAIPKIPGFTFAALGWSIRCRAIGGSQPKAPFSVWPDNRSLSPSLHLEEVLHSSYEKLAGFATVFHPISLGGFHSAAVPPIFPVKTDRDGHCADPLHDAARFDDFLVPPLRIRQMGFHLLIVKI
jgi:hypothetical protein